MNKQECRKCNNYGEFHLNKKTKKYTWCNFHLAEISDTKTTCKRFEPTRSCDNCKHLDFSDRSSCHSKQDIRESYRLLPSATVGVEAKARDRVCDFWNV